MRPKIHKPALVVAVLLALSISGCAGENTGGASGDANDPAAGSQSSKPEGYARQGAAVLRDARTAADRKNHTCSAPTPEPVTETLYDPVIVADGDLTIGDVRAVGDGVELVDAEGAVLVGNPHDVGRGMSVSWPWQDDRRLPIDSATRAGLVGMTVRDGQNVLPLLRLRFAPDSHLRGLSIDYTWGEDNHAQLFVQMDSTYARHLSGC